MQRLDGEPRRERYNYSTFVGLQAFNSDEPTHRLNNTNWYLKWQNKRPGFFLQVEKVFREMPIKCFLDTAKHKANEIKFAGWQEQVEQYFNQSIEEIKKYVQ